MLILPRRRNEFVVITLPDGRRGTVHMLEIRGAKARLGFEFSDDVTIHRSEIQDIRDGVEPKPHNETNRIADVL